MTPDILQTILRDSDHHLDQFSKKEISALEQKVRFKTIRGKETPFVPCAVRQKEVQLKPEEIVRQLYAARLLKKYRYPPSRLAFEHPVHFGREKKSADIVIFDQDRLDAAYIVVELKKPKLKDGKGQLRSYCNATGAPIGVWTNGGQISHYHRKDPNHFEDIGDIPKANQQLADILGERFTLKDLILKDKLANERKSLKDIILEMEDEVLANAGVDVFEEVFKLIFTKLFDEFRSQSDKAVIQHHIDQRVRRASQTPPRTASDYESLKEAVGAVADDGFRPLEFRNTGQTDAKLKNKIQSLFNDAKKQWKGVFPASAAFELSDGHLAVRVARTLNLIAGDGETNVLHLNTLDFGRWEDKTEKDRKWIQTYGGGFERLEELRTEEGQNKHFNFDIVMANPPFAGDIKESRLLHQYNLAFKPGGKTQNKVGRDILFIERNLDFLKPGGRMAIVLPQGRFNNTSDKYIRDFIAKRARILAVVGLHGNTFKPHTGTKTSVLFVQKWDDELCPKVDDYPIFFAVSEKGGKDTSGDYVCLKDENGRDKLDKNGHLIVDHDLHNHDGELPDGIAEAFAQFAQSEKLSFWKE